MEKLVNRRGRRGLAVLEAAIFFPLLFLLLFGLIDYGWVFLKYQCIGNAAREGVRVAVREGATDAHWQAAVGNVLNRCGITTAPATPPALAPGVGSDVGTQLTCTVTITEAEYGLGGVHLFPRPSPLVGTATMNKEGPIPAGPP
jgi:Flp pilus assembly protein TadG